MGWERVLKGCEEALCGDNNVLYQGLPGGPVIKNPPSNAGDEGLIPGQGTKSPHMPRSN